MDEPDPVVVAIPAWLRAKVDQRLAELDEYFAGNVPKTSVVMMPLSEEYRDVDKKKWERMCDNCGIYIPEGTDLFYIGNMAVDWHGIQVIFIYGTCANCKGEPIDG